MKLLHRSFLPLLLAAGLGAAAAARGQLVASSPFLPPGASAAAGGAGAAAGPVELRGIMSTPDGTSFCIYDTVKKTSVWVGLNEPGRPFVVKSYDPAHDAVSLAEDGRTTRITLHTAKITSTGPSGIGGASRGMPNAINQTVVINPTPADEAKRLEAVAAEVQRRRMLREQAMRGNSPGSAPAPGTPGAQPPLERR